MANAGEIIERLFPACAGVILTPVRFRNGKRSFPRMRGGDPLTVLKGEGNTPQCQKDKRKEREKREEASGERFELQA